MAVTECDQASKSDGKQKKKKKIPSRKTTLADCRPLFFFFLRQKNNYKKPHRHTCKKKKKEEHDHVHARDTTHCQQRKKAERVECVLPHTAFTSRRCRWRYALAASTAPETGRGCCGAAASPQQDRAASTSNTSDCSPCATAQESGAWRGGFACTG